MKRREFIPSIMALVTLMLTSCAMYHPQLADIALIDHKGDTRVSASLMGGNVGATITTGLTNHMAVQLTGNVTGNDQNYFHGAIGFYDSRDHFCIEGYIGLGNGYAHNSRKPDPTTYSYGRYTIPFVQVNLGWRNLTKAHIDCGVAFKYGRYYPHIKNYTWGYNPVTDTDEEVVYSYSTTNSVIEPQAFFRIGGEMVKFNFQVGYCYLDDLRRKGVGGYNPFVIASGITLFL